MSNTKIWCEETQSQGAVPNLLTFKISPKIPLSVSHHM
jgi:hypothetical protein